MGDRDFFIGLIACGLTFAATSWYHKSGRGEGMFNKDKYLIWFILFLILTAYSITMAAFEATGWTVAGSAIFGLAAIGVGYMGFIRKDPLSGI